MLIAVSMMLRPEPRAPKLVPPIACVLRAVQPGEHLPLKPELGRLVGRDLDDQNLDEHLRATHVEHLDHGAQVVVDRFRCVDDQRVGRGIGLDRRAADGDRVRSARCERRERVRRRRRQRCARRLRHGAAGTPGGRGRSAEGLVIAIGASDAVPIGRELSPVSTARSVCATRTASAFLRYRMWTLPVFDDVGASSCSISARARATPRRILGAQDDAVGPRIGRGSARAASARRRRRGTPAIRSRTAAGSASARCRQPTRSSPGRSPARRPPALVDGDDDPLEAPQVVGVIGDDQRVGRRIGGDRVVGDDQRTQNVDAVAWPTRSSA